MLDYVCRRSMVHEVIPSSAAVAVLPTFKGEGCQTRCFQVAQMEGRWCAKPKTQVRTMAGILSHSDVFTLC